MIWRLLVAALLVLSSGAWAAKVPDPGETDHRIRKVDYNPDQVYRITGYYGYALTVILDRAEKIEQVILGDPSGWDLKTEGHVLSLKPKAEQPDTSMVVLSDKRVYTFDVRAKPARKTAAGQAEDKEQAFLVRFIYPEQEAARRAAANAQLKALQETQRAANRQLDAERKLVANMPPKPINRNYWYSGAKELAPIEAWDDGTFTYLRFSAEQGIPAIFIVSIDGDELIAPKHFEQDVVVLQNLARRVVLRRGSVVTCIWNDGPLRQTQQPANGATDPASSRIERNVPEAAPRRLLRGVE